jgi:hypothetical protein
MQDRAGLIPAKLADENRVYFKTPSLSPGAIYSKYQLALKSPGRSQAPIRLLGCSRKPVGHTRLQRLSTCTIQICALFAKRFPSVTRAQVNSTMTPIAMH